MRTFKVITLSVGGRGNKIFRLGDIVKENNFPDGNADKLVKRGFLEPTGETDEFENIAPDDHERQVEITVDEVEETEVTEETTEPDEHSSDETSNDDEPEAEELVNDLDKISVSRLRKDLKKRKVAFEKDATKEQLYALWLMN